MTLIFIILIIVGLWFAHSKMGVSFGAIGAAVAGIVMWALKTSGSEDKEISDIADKVQRADDQELVSWVHQRENIHLNNMAARELKRRYGSEWRKYV